MTDSAQEYLIDKIVFDYQEFQKLQKHLNQSNSVLVSGLFGSYNEIEKQLFDEIHIKPDNLELLNDSKKGNLIGVRFQHKIIFCLILQLKFFQSKPIKEKAIELTLFRILQDLTDNIKICLDDEIYKHWYLGGMIPFSPFIVQRQQYVYVEQGDQEIQEYKCPLNNVVQDMTQYQVVHSQHQSPFLTIIQELKFNEQDFKQNYKAFFGNLFNQFIQKDQFRIPEFSLIRKQYLSQNYKNQLQAISDNFKNFFPNQFTILEKNGKLNSSEKQSTKLLEQIQSKIEKTYKQQLDQISNDLKKTTKYSINKLNCKIRRSEEKRIESIWFQIEQNQQVILGLDHQTIKIRELFQTKDKAEILLIETKSKFSLYFRAQNSEQYHQVQNYDLEKAKNIVCFFKISHSLLYLFNFNDKQVLKISFFPNGRIDEQIAICEQCVKLEKKVEEIYIKQVAYLSQQKKFILLTQKKNVYFFMEDYKQIIEAKCSSNNNKKQPLHFSQNSKEEQLLSCPSGKYFYFSNGEYCFMYDVNGLEVRKIKINGKIKIFEDKSDIIIIDNITKITQNNSVIILANAIKQKTINKLGDEEKQIEGNPSLDIIKGSCIKFGPNSVFLSKSKKKQISFSIDKERFTLIESYFNKINLNYNINLGISKLQFSEISLQDLYSIIFSRVPLQLCTTENGILIPLFDGFRKETSNEQIVCVYEKSKQLRLGFIEEFLKNNKSQIFVIGIIGKQSSGKSYLLNRVFGTRFSVSSARCTDGIWASIGWIEGQKFLILDCEGLFNSARTNQEEVQMLAFLTAICDISILNSDITFNRYMNDLFNNLTNASSQLKGETLFKGQLHIALRDVSSTDNSEIDNELLTNLYRLKSQDSQDIVFLKKLFNNNFTVEKLFNFEHQQFDEQIIDLRQYFSTMAQTSKRWEDGENLVSMMKILLCQLELSDHGNANLIDLKLQVEKIIENQIKLWHQFSINQPSNCKLVQQEYEFPQILEEIIFFNSSLLKQLSKDLNLNITILNHNENLNIMENEIQKLMTSRKEYILEQTKQELQKYQQPEIIEIKSKEEGLLTIYINNQIQQYQFCREKCSHCYLYCNQFKNHIKEYEKLITIFQDQQKILEKVIAESSIKTDDQQQQIQQRSIDIYDELQQLDIIISQKELQQRKEDIQRKLIKQIQKLQKFSFCDTKNRKFKLEFLNIQQIQNQKSITELTAENCDKIIIEIKNNQEKINQQLIENLGTLDQIQNDIKITEESITNIKNEIIIKQDSHKKQSLQNNELEQTLACQQKDLSNILQEQQMLKQHLLQQLDLKIEDNNLIEQQKQIEAKILDEEKQDFNMKKLVTTLEQNIQTFQQQKQTLSQESQIFDEQKEIRKEEDMLLKKIEDLQKQIDKIDKITYIKRQLPNVQAIFITETQKLKNELNITSDSDLDLKYRNIVATKIQYQAQLQKLKFEQQIILEQIQKQKQKQNPSKKQQLEKFMLQYFVTHKYEEKSDLIVEFDNVQKNQQNLNNLKTAQEKLSIYQKFQDQQKQIEYSINETKCQLTKNNKQIKSIEQQQMDQFNSQQQQQIKLNELQQNNNNLKGAKNQMEQALQNMKQQEGLFSECLKILFKIEDYSDSIKISKQEFDGLVNMKQLQIKDKSCDQEYKLLLKEKEKLQNEKEKLDQRLQKYSKLGEDKQQLEKLKNKINSLRNLKCDVHSCQRESHICDQQCSQCIDKQCNQKAGHDEKQEHLCSKQDHICEKDCRVQDCKNKCNNIRNHKGHHTCNEKHICQKTCEYCEKQCQYDRTDIHQTHICIDKNNGCNQECELCKKNCSEQHQHSVKRGKYCEKMCIEIHQHNRQPQGTHLCSNIHFCKETCSNQGICNVEYESVQLTWKTNISEFQYTKYIPKNGGKKICMHQIAKGKYHHDQEHICMRDTDVQFHYCDQKCPECQSFCELQYGHAGLHYSSKHRNKDDQKFTQQQGKNSQIKVLSEDGKVVKNYVVGDVSSPETCRESCKRRGRSHFHLVECKGGDKCLEKTLQRYARHSKEKYQGFEHKKFDEILCFQFWEQKMWAHPLQNTDDIDIIQGCDAYCPQCLENKQFCQERGWHTNSNKIKDHKFACGVNHQQDLIHGIDVAFVIDTTASMSSYINSCIEIIKKTMQKFIEYKEQIQECNFAVVSYKDHDVPYNINQQVVQVQNFATAEVINQFLGQLKAEGGGDYAEALLDGLDSSISLGWTDKNVKVLYLIADAPPHGNNNKKKMYHNFRDDFPDGCPCGLEQTIILQKIQDKNIQLKIIKLNQNLEMMISKFKDDYSKLIELTPLNIEQDEFQNILINDICKYLEHNEITYQYKY